MAANRTSFEKLQRDRAKKARAAAKREKRRERRAADSEESTELPEVAPPPEGEVIPAPDLLKMVEAIHQQYDNGDISFEDFEERKAELMAMLTID